MPDETDDLESLADELSPDEVVEAVKAGMSVDPVPEPGGGHIQLDMSQVRQPDAGRNWGSRIRAGGNIGGNVVLLCTPGGDVIASGLRYEPSREEAPVEPMRAKEIEIDEAGIQAVLLARLNGKTDQHIYQADLPEQLFVGRHGFRVTGGKFGNHTVFVIDHRHAATLNVLKIFDVLPEREGWIVGGDKINPADVEGFVVAARERYGIN